MPKAYIQLGANGSSPSICPARATGWGGGNGLRICPIVHSCSLWPAQTLLVGIRVQPPWRAIQTLNVELVTSVFNV